MRKHTIRTVILVLATAWTLYYAYPTLVYTAISYLSPEKRAQIDARFMQKDEPTAPETGMFSKTVNSVKQWAMLDPEKRIKLGLDLQGGIDMVLGLDMNALPEDRRKELEDANVDVSAARDSALHRIWLRAKNPKPDAWMNLVELGDEFVPEAWIKGMEMARKAGHGGGDFFEVLDFVDALQGRRPAPIGIDEAMDMTLPGLVSQQSIIRDGAWMAVPDSRDWR